MQAMSNVIVNQGQNFLDVSIQNTGTVENAFLIAKENSVAVSDYLIPGYEMMVPGNATIVKGIFKMYKEQKIKPATSWQPTLETPEDKKGIGRMQIGSTFKVY